MTKLFETALLAALGALLATAVASDLKDGVVRNRTLTRFTLAIAPLVGVCYVGPGRAYFGDFLLNVGTCVAAAFALFCAKLLAGGDCKLLCCASFVFPASCRVSYRETDCALLLAPMLAFGVGYLFLTLRAVTSIALGRTKLDGERFKANFWRFARNYFRAFVYLSAFDLALRLSVSRWFELNPLLTLALYLGVVWASWSFETLRRPLTVAITLALAVAASAIFQIAFFNASGSRCLLALCVVLSRLLAENASYRRIATSDVKKGTILALETTLRFLNSPIPGLPSLSGENLRSRLTEEEAASVRKWGETAPDRAEVLVVLKVPFTIFIALGFGAYVALAVGIRNGWIGGV